MSIFKKILLESKRNYGYGDVMDACFIAKWLIVASIAVAAIVEIVLLLNCTLSGKHIK
jgi:hypothetical protein